MNKWTKGSLTILGVAVVATVFHVAFAAGNGEQIPGSKWRVHDTTRPLPPVVKPAAKLGDAPSDAIVLFDGTAESFAKGFYHMERKKDGKGHTGKKVAPYWPVKDGVFTIKGYGQITSRESFGDCQLHVEWSAPVEPGKKGQHKGNSGVFPMGLYEVQVLDTYNDENTTYADGQAGAVYGQNPPMVNPARKPGEWNSYDILFRAPQFNKDKSLKTPGYMTVLFNGVVVQNNFELKGPALHRRWTKYRYHEAKRPLTIQDHGHPVRFRNIWIRPLQSSDQANETKAGEAKK
jgi:hypothetical protein